jgi:hypothetical protein
MSFPINLPSVKMNKYYQIIIHYLKGVKERGVQSLFFAQGLPFP